MKKRNWLALLVCLTLPVSALAVKEGEVEDAPMVETQLENWQTDTSYLPDASYYGSGEPDPIWGNSQTWYESELDEDGYYRNVTQNPRLTAGEIKRAQKLLAEYQAGKTAYTGESVLEKMEGVIVGVYALNPADFDGEQAYVLLPGTCLTDEQLLSIIAAYDEMGLAFDPASLNYRNCSRGGGIEVTRFYTEEETERNSRMRISIQRGTLVPPENLVLQAAQVRRINLEKVYFCGLDDFLVLPYRSMTDEELVARLIKAGVHDERGEIDHGAVEAQARTALYQAFRCPLSMVLTQIDKEGSYAPLIFTRDGRNTYTYEKDRKAYGAHFSYYTEEGVLVYADTRFDAETGDVRILSVIQNNPNQENQIFNPAPVPATQEMIDASLAQLEKELGLSGVAWNTVREDEMTNNWGRCIPVYAVMEEKWLMTVYVDSDDGQVRGMTLAQGALVETLPELDWGPNG